jgi:hypothetical protein
MKEELDFGQQLENEGKLQEAILKYREAVCLDPNEVDPHYKLAQALMRKGHWMESVASYQKVVELDPDQYEVCHELGEYLKNLSHFDKAKTLYETIGKTLEKKGRLGEAISVYFQAIQFDIDPKWFYLYIGDIKNRENDIEAAIDSYLGAIRIAPEFWQPHDRILIRIQRSEVHQDILEKIVVTYRTVIEQKPDYLLAYSNLGDVLTKLNRLDEAFDFYQRGTYRKNLQCKTSFLEQAWDSQKIGEEPTFIIIGSMRCGTTSLYEYISQHPQFVPALKKEVKFFNFHWTSGKEWYLAHFPPIADGSGYITGEGSPDYLYYPGAAKRVSELFPNMKLIVMLRNPVDRAISQYYHWLKVGAEHRPLEEVIASEIELVREMANPSSRNKSQRKGNQGCLLESIYILFLRKWMSIFPRNQFFIIKSEDFYTSPASVLEQVFNFINLPNYSLPEYKTYNANSYSDIDRETRKTLLDCFQPHNRELEKYLGMEFGWD